MSSLKAFVSSTFTDLQAHRRRVIDTLRGGSLHVDPMENWTASSSEPKEFSQDRMKGCDVCILLVAFRKGYVPDGETLSITQMEYRCAVEHGMNVLVFLLDDAETSWPFDERQIDPEIGRWREELRKKHGVQCFRADPMSLDVGPAVLRWIQERVKKLMLTSPFDFSSFLDLKRQGFVGREWLFAQIEQWRTARPEKSLLILGAPGIGKSAIAAELVRRYPEQVLGYHCCRADERSTLEPAKIVRALAAQVAQTLPEYLWRLPADALSEAGCNSDPINALTRGLLAPLRELPSAPGGVRYLLFDALDEALTREGAGLNLVEMLAYRLNELPAWLRIVATARREDDVLEKLHALQALPLNAQDEHNQNDVRQYVEEHVADAEVRRVLIEKSEGNFLYVRNALEALKGEAKPAEVLRSLPKGLHGIYPGFFKRRFPDENRYTNARPVLQVMVAAREPLTEAQLSAAAGLDEESVLPGVLSELEQFLVRRTVGGNEVVVLYHKSLSDWLTDKQLRRSYFYASTKTGQERLADWCWQSYQRGPRTMDNYTLRHLPAHLIETERWDRLAALLTDLCYLEHKAEAGFIFELAGDFGAAVKAVPVNHERHGWLSLLEEALGLDLAFLPRHPSALFQSLWNRCWWYDALETAAHYRKEPEKGAPFWQVKGAKFSELLEKWRKRKNETEPGFYWVRMLRPPSHHLGTAVRKILHGHEGFVTSVAMSPDGKRLASGSYDFTVRLWDAETGVQLRRLEGHTHHVNSVSFSPDGKRLASGSDDNTVRLWDAETGAELRILEGHGNSVSSVSFNSDGTRLASGSNDCSVLVWDVERRTEPRRLKGHTNAVWSVSFNPDGTRLASGSIDNTVRLWDAETGTELLQFEGDTDGVTSVSFSADGKRLASASWDNIVRLWDAETGAELRRLVGHSGAVYSVSFSMDGKRLASASWDNTVRLWNAETGEEVRRLEGHTNAVWSVSFNPDGKSLASGSYDFTVRLWNAETGTHLRRLEGHAHHVSSVSFSADGKRLASISEAGTVRLWDTQKGACIEGIQGDPFAAAYLYPFRWRAVSDALETVIQETKTGHAVAWVALAPSDITVHPSGRIWTGHIADYVCLFTLEGGDAGSLSSLDKPPTSRAAAQ